MSGEDYFTRTEADAARWATAHADPDDDTPTRAELEAEDLPYEPVPHYVCDGCMRVVTSRQVAVWADFEHVLCHACATDERDPWMARSAGACVECGNDAPAQGRAVCSECLEGGPQ